MILERKIFFLCEVANERIELIFLFFFHAHDYMPSRMGRVATIFVDFFNILFPHHDVSKGEFFPEFHHEIAGMLLKYDHVQLNKLFTREDKNPVCHVRLLKGGKSYV